MYFLRPPTVCFDFFMFEPSQKPSVIHTLPELTLPQVKQMWNIGLISVHVVMTSIIQMSIITEHPNNMNLYGIYKHSLSIMLPRILSIYRQGNKQNSSSCSSGIQWFREKLQVLLWILVVCLGALVRTASVSFKVTLQLLSHDNYKRSGQILFLFSYSLESRCRSAIQMFNQALEVALGKLNYPMTKTDCLQQLKVELDLI